MTQNPFDKRRSIHILAPQDSLFKKIAVRVVALVSRLLGDRWLITFDHETIESIYLESKRIVDEQNQDCRATRAQIRELEAQVDQLKKIVRAKSTATRAATTHTPPSIHQPRVYSSARQPHSAQETNHNIVRIQNTRTQIIFRCSSLIQQVADSSQDQRAKKALLQINAELGSLVTRPIEPRALQNPKQDSNETIGLIRSRLSTIASKRSTPEIQQAFKQLVQRMSSL